MPVKTSQHLIEVSIIPSGLVKTAQYLVEVLAPRVTPNPTTVSGIGVSQELVEVLARPSGFLKVAQYLVEVMIVPTSVIITSTGTKGSVTFK